MFLDDELLQITKKADTTTFENIFQLNVDLCKKCEKYYKNKLSTDGVNSKQIKVILDRTFNLWDSFVKMLEKDSNKSLNRLAPFFRDYSFKQQLLQNKEMNRIYSNLVIENTRNVDLRNK